MNKKFSTLVAMLLASGGLFYAVDAMVLPASEGVAKTFVTAAAQAEANGVITGYTLKAATFAEGTCTWKLEQNGGKYLLVAGEGFYLNDKLEVQKGKDGISGFTVADGVISGLYIKADGSLTTTAEGNQPAGLFATTGAIVTTAFTGSYALGPVAYGQGPLESLTNESLGLKMVAAADAKVQAAVFSTSETVSPAFTLEAGNGADSESLYLKLGEGAYLLSNGTEISIGAKPTEANVNSKITLESGTFKVKIGEKWLANSGATLSLGNATSNGTIYASTSDVVEGGTPTKAEDVDAGNTIALFTLGSSEIATTDYKVTFTPAVPAANTMVALTDVSGENFTNVDESMKFSLASKSLKLSGKFVTYDAEEGVVLSESTGNDFKLLSDGTLVYDLHVLSVNEVGAIVTTGGEPLYLYEATGKIAESTTSASTFVLSKKVLGKAPVTNLTGTDNVATAIAKEIDPSKPGVDVPGMEDITVAEDGKITLTADLSDIPAPHTISTGNGILSVKDGAVVYLSGDDAANATSWILKDGKYMSVEMAKLGKANAWLGNAPAGKAVAKTSYALVAAKDAIDAKATSAGVTLGNTPITATLTTTGTAVPVDVTLNADSKLNSVSNGAVVILGNGTSAFIKNAKGEVTDNIYQAALWVVNMSARADGSYNYSFKQKDTENYLTVGSAKDFVAEDYEGTFALKAADGYVSIPATGSATLETQSASSVLYAVPVSTSPFTAEEILSNHGTLTSFNLSLWDEKDGVSNLVQNPFEDADLVPVYYNGGTFTPITANSNDANKNQSTFLLKKGDSYIVAETTKDSEWSNINTELIAGGFKFVTLSEKAMAEVMTNAGKWKEGTYAPYFTFNYNENAVANGVATAKTPIYSINVAAVNKASVGNVSTFTIKTNTEAATYLTTSSKSDYWVYAEFSANNAVRGDSDKDYNPLNMKYVNITFVNHSSITWNNIKLDGKVLGAEAKPADAANFLFSKPEGQWAVKMTAATGDLSKGKELGDDVYRFTFKNRESGETYDVNKLFYLGNNKYAVSYRYTNDKFAENTGTLRDTIAITPVEGLKNNTRQFDGYKNMTAQEVQDQLFNLLVASAEEDYYVGENHTAKSHFLGLSHSEEAAVNWRIVPLTAARTYDANKDLTQASDSVYVFNNPQYYKASDKKFYQYNDTVAIISYALQNVANDEFLTYENPQTTDILSMICDPNFKSYKTTKNISDAHRFVLKEKGTDLYNIIAVDYPEYDTKGEFVAEGENAWASLNLGRKLYGATTLTKQGAVEVEGAYKQINSNDVFKVQMVGAPEYRLMNMGDTIRIFRQENEYDQMFEKGEFLNIGNKAQLTDMAPALYVDTAYVKRGHNNRYQYLLVVNPNYVPAEPCNIPGHPTVHPDTTYGRFLVNLVDTANVAYQKGAIHTNKYINDTEAGETRAKLGFVYGFRTADKLYITDKNFQKSGKASDVIDLSTRDFNVAKFAFRYINPINHESDGSFKIQTGYYDYDSYIATNKQPEVSNNGYLKNINGVLVVENTYDKGDKFDLAIEHSDPTANEGISANGVSVAAIDGAVIVKGAAGKTVVITNILGQTIANAVLSSDNETIAAPAGVVVVAVEGEAAVKAIVK